MIYRKEFYSAKLDVPEVDKGNCAVQRRLNMVSIQGCMWPNKRMRETPVLSVVRAMFFGDNEWKDFDHTDDAGDFPTVSFTFSFEFDGFWKPTKAMVFVDKPYGCEDALIEAMCVNMFRQACSALRLLIEENPK